MEGGLRGIHVPLISDANNKLCRDSDVLNEESGAAQRALFIIDPKGIVRGITINDAVIGRSVHETLRVIDALAFADEFGEGCPVDWKKGDKGIDVSTRNASDAPFEVRPKSCADWTRPKLGRAFSGTSQRSIASLESPGLLDGIVPTHASINSAAALSSRAASPNGDAMPRSGVMTGSHSPMIVATRPGSMRYNSQTSMLSPVSHAVPNTMEQQLETAME
jgi:hypothetical protein